jgi:hypothetical protein
MTAFALWIYLAAVPGVIVGWIACAICLMASETSRAEERMQRRVDDVLRRSLHKDAAK